MVDFTKIVLPKKYYKRLKTNPNLQFLYPEVSTDAEVTKNYIVAYKYNFTFKLYDNGRVIISGSFHYLYNHGLHNYNDFNLISFKLVLLKFLEIYDIKPEDATINQLEIGLNFTSSHEINKLLRHFYFHIKNEFKLVETKTEGKYYVVKHPNYYWVKFYNKGLQFETKTPIMRFELKLYGRKLKNQFGVTTIADLLYIPFQGFIDEILLQYDRTLFYDYTIREKSIRTSNYSNKIYWLDIKENLSPSSWNKHTNQLKEITFKYSDNIKQELRSIIKNKAIELTQGGVSIANTYIVAKDTP